MYEKGTAGIRWSMEYLDAYLMEEKKRKFPLLPDFGRPKRFTDADGEVEITFVLLPSRWLKRPQKLEKRLIRMIRRRPPWEGFRKPFRELFRGLRRTQRLFRDCSGWPVFIGNSPFGKT